MSYQVNLCKREIESNKTIDSNIIVNAGALIIGSKVSVNGDLKVNSGDIKTQRGFSVNDLDLNASIFEGGEHSTYYGIKNKAGSFISNDKSKIKGYVTVEAGDLEFNNTKIYGDISSKKGIVKLQNGSSVLGTINFIKPFVLFPFTRRNEKLIIGKNSIIEGDVICDYPVKLIIEEDAKINGSIIGPWIR